MSKAVTRSVLVTDTGKMLAPGIARLRDQGVTVTVLPDGTPPAEIPRAADGAGVIIDSQVPLGREEIEQLQGTRLIVRAGIGYDLIDVGAAAERGIWVANVPDYCIEEVADHTMLLLLASTRRLDDLANGWRREGRWFRYDALPNVHRPASQVLGIVGMGRIGEQVARRAKSFGWRVIAHDSALHPSKVEERGAEPVGLDELFARADAITLHCPLTPETRHLVDERRLARAKRGVVIVNTSRGGLIDLDALQQGIRSGQVGAAGVDVLEDEPVPDLTRPIFDEERLIVTSHVAWYSVEARETLALKCADEALRVLDGGVPLNAVNRPIAP